jgi:hypothetical protein
MNTRICCGNTLNDDDDDDDDNHDDDNSQLARTINLADKMLFKSVA